MVTVDPIVNNPSQYEVTQTESNELQDAFLTMLIAQIQYQDPLNPMENTEFTTQLAQINSVEQLQGVNKNLGYLQLYMASINNSQAIGFIGKEVVATGDSIYWDGETPATLNYHLSNNATNVVINVYDTNNHLVDTIRCGSQERGMQQVTWNGTYLTGSEAPEGTYKFKVMATDSSGNTVTAATMLSGPVEGISFEDGVTYVLVNGQRIPIGDIVEIKTERQAAAGDETTGTVDEDEEADEGESSFDDMAETAIALGKLALKVAPFLL